MPMLEPLERAWICHGRVVHRRVQPVSHKFAYGVFFLRLPLSRLSELRVPLLGIDRPSLFSVRFVDHGPRDGTHPLPWIRGVLGRNGLACADGEVVLQTFPRMFGYVFNPVSFWFCHDRAGALRAVLAEVHNTFGEHHFYLLAHDDTRPIEARDELSTDKVFHVSPFFEVRGHYRFRFRFDGVRALASIDYLDASGPLLHTSIEGRCSSLQGGALARAAVSYAWLTAAVIVRIHWQALRLWLKRVRFFGKPQPPAEPLSR